MIKAAFFPEVNCFEGTIVAYSKENIDERI